MNFIQRQHSWVKFLIYLVVVFIGGFFLSVVLGLIFSKGDTIEDWVFTVAYILSFVATFFLAIVTEHNHFSTLKEHALALRKDISIVQTRTENVLFQLESLMMTHMEHEKDMYTPKDIRHEEERNTKGPFKKLHTMSEIRSSIRQHPSLRSDDDVMRLFDEIVKENNQLMNKKTEYNSIASQYNAQTQKMLGKIFNKSWKLERLDYYNDSPEI